MGLFDFFIAHAGPDTRQAKKLYWELEDQQCQVFLDQQGISPGAPWSTTLRDNLQASRATVVLISSHTDAAFYQHEEIAHAIQLGRDNPQAHTVIPVLLEKLPESHGGMPYGTGILQAMDATKAGGLERIAHELADWIAECDQRTQPETPLSSGNYLALGAALRMDRYPQWSGVLEESLRPGHVLFLLRGPRHQNVALFVERIQRYLSQETRFPHAVYRVRFNWEGIKAHCGADWPASAAGAGLTGKCCPMPSPGRPGAGAVSNLGLRPLDRLDDNQQAGLREFLTESLPGLLNDARPGNDIRILLALDYEETEISPGTLPPLVQHVDAWGQQARAGGRLRYRLLPRVKLPTWEELEDYFNHQSPRPPPAMVDELRAEYRRLISGSRLSYQELADLLDRYLQDA
jgi:hypothetical protein